MNTSIFKFSTYCHNRFRLVSVFSRYCSTSLQNRYTLRTHHCGELRSKNVGDKVTLFGWLKHKRSSKFLVLGDVYGTVQVINFSNHPDLVQTLRGLNVESVLKITGTVAQRPEKDKNPQMPTGEIEVHLIELQVLNNAKHPLPVDVHEFVEPNIINRMRYRYLDLRRPKLQYTLRFRAHLISQMRKFLESQKFVEIETPTLFRRTPGGANEFIVPSSSQPGLFYSLPQSPQQFKQLLMVAGVDRYFQIARCYRDEGLKSDRQPEFTQLDVELSFTDQEHVMKLVEDLIIESWPAELLSTYGAPSFSRMTFADVMRDYGIDKPDLRFDWKIRYSSHHESSSDHLVYLTFPNFNNLFDTTFLDECRKFLKATNPLLLADFFGLRRSSDDSFFKTIDHDLLPIILTDCPADHNAAIYFRLNSADDGQQLDKCRASLGVIRGWLANKFEIAGYVVRRDEMRFLWVVDFPLFLPLEETERENDNNETLWESAHHPFTAPNATNSELMKNTPPGKIIGQHYDLVLNGCELGGGSVRIHNSAFQRYVLKEILRENRCDAELKHLLEALDYGAPPHAGFAIGLDRYVAMLLKAPSIRQVIAFPKLSTGRDVMTGAPCAVDDQILKRYHVKVDHTTILMQSNDRQTIDDHLEQKQLIEDYSSNNN